MKKLISVLMMVAALVVAGCCCATQAQAQKQAPKQPRKVALQSYSLRVFTLEEALNKVKGLGLDGIECFPGQRLSDKYPKAKVGPSLNAEERAYMKKLLKDANLKMISFGVTGATKEAEIEKICQFAKEMGAERVLTEAPVYWIPVWNKYCKKYGLTMCLHHHATNSANQYWDADVMKKYISGYSNVRANPDPGHWGRAGRDLVKSLKTLEGLIASVHMKDEMRFNDINNKCVPLGEGVLDIKGVLAELDRQGYDGYFVIEYEADWQDNVGKIKKCIDYLRKN